MRSSMLLASISIIEVGKNTLLFGEVLSLWRPNSSTLGFMPAGGFEDAAENKTLVAAVDADGRLHGYVMYRVSRAKVSIAHLCIAPTARGGGIARILVNEVSRRNPRSAGVGLWCRKDFDANGVWQHLGFSAKAYRRGRGGGESVLVFWFKDHGHDDLFSLLSHDQVEAAIDSCVLFDVLDVSDSKRNEESNALLADWLQDSVRLLITPEAGNDIQRDSDMERVAKRNQGKSAFDEIRVPPDTFRSAERTLVTVLPPAQDEQTASDYRHLAWAVSAGVKYFITRDAALIALRATVGQHGLRIMSPGEFIRHIDELERSEAYRPEILFGTQFRFINISDQNITLAENLANSRQGEKVKILSAKIRALLANPRETRVRALVDSSGSIHALIGERDINSNRPTICLLRLQSAASAPTLAHFLSSRLILENATSPSKILRIEDSYASDEFTPALIQAGFENDAPGNFSRICGKGIAHPESFSTVFGDIPSDPDSREKKIWPVKASSSVEKAYIIPIRPHNAACLFDHELAKQSLFCGVNPDLLLQSESAYYSSSRVQLESGSWVLWYVSQGSGYDGTSAIRACSFVHESVRGTVKEIFGRFKRFGVFQWEDVKQLGKGAFGEITGIRFSRTECFDRPVPLSEIIDEIGSAPVGPRPISYELFLRLYRQGMNL